MKESVEYWISKSTMDLRPSKSRIRIGRALKRFRGDKYKRPLTYGNTTLRSRSISLPLRNIAYGNGI